MITKILTHTNTISVLFEIIMLHLLFKKHHLLSLKPWYRSLALPYRIITLFRKDCCIDMKGCPLVRELKQCHTLSQGLLCILKNAFSMECHTLSRCKIINIENTHHMVNYVIWKWWFIFSTWMISCFEGILHHALFMLFFIKSSSTLEKECHTLMCMLRVYLRESLSLSELELILCKTYHICSKMTGRHGALFLEECCAHLRILLHSNDTLYQRNVAPSAKECCL